MAKGSHVVWADYQIPPVICIYCGKRVLVNSNWRGDSEKGTYHTECDPIRVELVVTLP